MNYIDKKLQVFEQSVVEDANKKKFEIENELSQHKKEVLDQFELELLEEAYFAIQKEK